MEQRGQMGACSKTGQAKGARFTLSCSCSLVLIVCAPSTVILLKTGSSAIGGTGVRVDFGQICAGVV